MFFRVPKINIASKFCFKNFSMCGSFRKALNSSGLKTIYQWSKKLALSSTFSTQQFQMFEMKNHFSSPSCGSRERGSWTFPPSKHIKVPKNRSIEN